MVTPDILTANGITGLTELVARALITAANQDIDARFGSIYSVTEDYTSDTPMYRVFTKRGIDTITSVQHGPTFRASDLITLTEEADDGFIQVNNHKTIQKLGGCFQRCVRITYKPVSDEERRDQVVIDLIKLCQRYGTTGALISKSVGSLSETYSAGDTSDYSTEREKIMANLSVGQRNWA